MTCHFLVGIGCSLTWRTREDHLELDSPKNKGHYEVPEHLTFNLTSKVNYDMPFSRWDWLLRDLENTLGPFRTRFAKK